MAIGLSETAHQKTIHKVVYKDLWTAL